MNFIARFCLFLLFSQVPTWATDSSDEEITLRPNRGKSAAHTKLNSSDRRELKKRLDALNISPPESDDSGSENDPGVRPNKKVRPPLNRMPGMKDGLRVTPAEGAPVNVAHTNEPLGARKRSQSLDETTVAHPVLAPIVLPKSGSDDTVFIPLETPRVSRVNGWHNSSDGIIPKRHQRNKKTNILGSIGSIIKSVRDLNASPNEDLYRDYFVNYGGLLESLDSSDRETLYQEKIVHIHNKLKTRENVYAYFRDTENMKDILMYFRKITRDALVDIIAIHEQKNLSFLNVGSQVPMSMEESQKGYISFLDQIILPMVVRATPEISFFFYRAARAAEEVLAAEKVEGFDIFDFATNAFVLSVINPVLSDFREKLITYSSKELVTYEKKEMAQVLEINTLPEKGSELEIKLLEGVAIRMRSSSREKTARTCSKKRTAEEDLLKRLIQKTFRAPSEFQAVDYAGLQAFFSLLIASEGELIDFKKQLKGFFMGSCEEKRANLDPNWLDKLIVE